jgi:selenobiotic family peptide radical SAM maturase
MALGFMVDRELYPLARRYLPSSVLQRLCATVGVIDSDVLSSWIDDAEASGDSAPPFLRDLVRLEWTQSCVVARPFVAPVNEETFQINPTLELLHLGWRCADFLRTGEGDGPLEGDEWAMVWKDPDTAEVVTAPASEGEVLSLALLADPAGPYEVEPQAGLGRDARYALLRWASKRRVVLAPPSRIRRSPADLLGGGNAPDSYTTANWLSLQWHITNRCELHCKHCYDRSSRAEMALQDGYRVLQELAELCQSRAVLGHVAFTGGNPFLHTDFFDLYARAVYHGFGTSVLANPVSERQVAGLLKIAMPAYFQVSLEGLEEHNDSIRGAGHFRRVMTFIELLKRMGVSAGVMLTLTRDNLHHVLPLVRALGDRVDVFGFSRLAPFGSGASLALPSRDEYRSLLCDYFALARENPRLRLKENLLNLVHGALEEPPIAGCTQFGCGAAFNSFVLLADGEVHACRRLPSLIGSVYEKTLSAIYGSHAAARYRLRPDACRGCSLIAGCGGCPAVTAGLGLDPFRDRDPFCWRD